MDSFNKIPEIKSINDEYRSLKREINRRRQKLKTLYSKYSFITEIIDPKVPDLQLEVSVKKLFSDLGYKAKQPDTKQDLDVIARFGKDIIGIEVKNDRHVGENELFQGIKYVGRHKRNGIEMHPLMIWNNSKERHQFDDNRISDAENHKFGILTTEELLKGYLKVKQNKINLKLFNTIINQTGLIKFSNSTIKRMNSGKV
ncbi:MAG: hypothetical protein GXO79_14045 [Chlorobi bacterium]|nr:hypothetical protein [Chlorobiota bacterium]